MAKTRNAVALRNFSDAGTGYLAGAVIKDMAENQFNDWQKVELVREATAAEVAAFDKGQAPEPVDGKLAK